MVVRKPYFNDNQIKRMLVQIMSCFSGYQVKTGTQRDGKEIFRDVPVIYGDMSRVAGYIVGPRGDQDNTVSYVPIISVHMTRLVQKADMRLSPQHREKYNFIERAKDADGKLLSNQAGVKKTVERYMPVPYEMGVAVSMWTSNNDEGYQLIEQIATVFNPDMEIQLSNSPADWTFLTSLIFEGNVEMEKVQPSGTDTDPMYVFRMDFTTVVWISPPAKVYETNNIYNIQVPIKDLESAIDFDSMDQIDGLVIKATDEKIQFFEDRKIERNP